MGYLTVCIPYSVLSNLLLILIGATRPSVYLVIFYLTTLISRSLLSNRLNVLLYVIRLAYTGCPREECEILRESVPYVKLYRYNPKHLYPKLNGYGDNGQRILKL